MSLSFRRAIGRLVPLLVLAALGSCSGELPGSAVTESQAERAYGILNPSTPIVSVIRDRGLKPPDPAAAQPLLDQLAGELAKSDPGGAFAGITYELTRGNALQRNWIVQTPDRWGRSAADLPFYPMDCKECDKDISLPACSSDADCRGGTCGAIWPLVPGPRAAKRQVCLGHSDALIVRIHDLVASARQTVDIAELQPVPDGRFLAALRAAIAELALSRRPVAIRVLIGQFPPAGVDPAALLKELVADARDIPGSRITVSVAAMRSCTAFETCNSFSWPHAKLISVDGREALVGGHNLWAADYLLDNPVHDLSMQVRGPAAANATRFTDRLWQFVCQHLDQKASISLASYSPGESEPGRTCPPAFAARRQSAGTDGVAVLGVGRMGSGITEEFANQSELARDLMFGAARRNIYIAQQDLGFRLGRSDTLYPESALDRLVDLMLEHDGNVYVVLSNPGSVGNGGIRYHNDVPLQALAKRVREIVEKRFEAADPESRYAVRKGPDPVNALLCSRFHLAPFRFGPDASWPGGKTIANHGKFWMIDDGAFYIGSDNMYPVNLQEFGYIVDDRQAAAEILDAYWKPLWQWSQRAAVSGDGVENCIFRELVK